MRHPAGMRVTVLASGSGGNAALVAAGGTRLLVDAGIGPDAVEERMRRVLGAKQPVDAVVLTHPHGDHIERAEPCARRFGAPVYLTEACARRVRLGRSISRRVFGAATRFRVGAIEVSPMPIPHDAPQVALVFGHDAPQTGRVSKAGLVTDLGQVPPGLAAHLDGCQLVLCESNHDEAMLEAGPYPPFLKRRVAGPLGHLSNEACAGLLRGLGNATREVVLMHISARNNRPDLALTVAAQALRKGVRLRAADQDQPLDAVVDPTRVQPPPRGIGSSRKRARRPEDARQLSLAGV